MSTVLSIIGWTLLGVISVLAFIVLFAIAVVWKLLVIILAVLKALVDTVYDLFDFIDDLFIAASKRGLKAIRANNVPELNDWISEVEEVADKHDDALSEELEDSKIKTVA